MLLLTIEKLTKKYMAEYEHLLKSEGIKNRS